jgi:hypothetical protein
MKWHTRKHRVGHTQVGLVLTSNYSILVCTLYWKRDESSNKQIYLWPAIRAGAGTTTVRLVSGDSGRRGSGRRCWQLVPAARRSQQRLAAQPRTARRRLGEDAGELRTCRCGGGGEQSFPSSSSHGAASSRRPSLRLPSLLSFGGAVGRRLGMSDSSQSSRENLEEQQFPKVPPFFHGKISRLKGIFGTSIERCGLSKTSGSPVFHKTGRFIRFSPVR